MTRELAGLEADLSNVGINNSYTTHSQLRNKAQISDAAGENNLLFTPATSNTHDDETATSLNLCSPSRDNSVLITINNASENSTKCDYIFTSYGIVS